jgi:hypothetical protein
LFRHALAGLQFDLDLQRFGVTSQLCALNGVPGDWRGRTIERFVLRRGARYQPVFAGRDVVEGERAVAAGDR